MDWVLLVASGMLEAVWANALAASKGLRRPIPVIIFAVTAVASLVGLGIAMRTLPTGSAYAVWVGVGATLTVAWAMWRKVEKVSLAKILLLLGIVGCVVGLRLVA